MSAIQKGRDLTFDIVRALCIVEVVCFWHVKEYIDTNFISHNLLTVFGYVTTAVLGTFTFMSGYFLKRYRIESAEDVKHFYLARFKRFWLLFFLASLTLYLASSFAAQPWYTSFSNFLLSLFGLSCFFLPLPPTLWYLVMLMFFYMITPVILCMRNRPDRIIISVLLYGLFVVLAHLNCADNRLLIYFPIYALGLLLDNKFVEYLKSKPLLTLFVSLIVLAIVIVLFHSSAYFSFLVCIVGFPIILSFSELLVKNRVVRIASSFISYSSLCMYLFHRHFYLGFMILWHGGNMDNIRDALYPVWFAYLIVCPCLIVSCFYIQKVYDSVVKRWWG